MTVKKTLPNIQGLTIDQQAYMYRAHIGKLGITPKPFMKETTDQVFTEFCDAVKAAIELDMKLTIEEELQVFISPLV